MQRVAINIRKLPDYIFKECKTSEDIINTGIYDHLGKDITDEIVNNISYEELEDMVRRFEYITFWSLIQTDLYKEEYKILNEAIDDFLAEYLPVSTDINYIMYTHLYIPGKIVKLSRKAIEDAIETGFREWVTRCSSYIYWFDIKFDYYSYAFDYANGDFRKPYIRTDSLKVLESREGIPWN